MAIGGVHLSIYRGLQHKEMHGTGTWTPMAVMPTGAVIT